MNHGKLEIRGNIFSISHVSGVFSLNNKLFSRKALSTDTDTLHANAALLNASVETLKNVRANRLAEEEGGCQ